jgi:hypothetical protein
VNGHPNEVAALEIAFSGMNAGTNAYAKTLDPCTNSACAVKCTHWRLEPEQEAIADLQQIQQSLSS